MKPKTKLSTSMTSAQFDNGYWCSKGLSRSFSRPAGSGVRYRLNRWREEQLTRGVKLTYEDLVREYVRLNHTKGPFAQIPHGRYINFMSNFLAAEQGATREQAIRAWTTLKTLDVPKDYRSWKRFRSSKGKQ